MKGMLMSKKGFGYFATNGKHIKNYGGTKIVGYTESREAVSMTVQ